MQQKICKNKKCQKVLPTGYKHKYCENCRNKRIETAKEIGTIMVGIAGVFIPAANKFMRGKK